MIAFRSHSQDRRPRLGEIHHGLDDEQVDPGSQLTAYLFPVDRDQVIKREFSGRLQEQAGWRQVAGDQGQPAGVFPAETVS